MSLLILAAATLKATMHMNEAIKRRSSITAFLGEVPIRKLSRPLIDSPTDKLQQSSTICTLCATQGTS
jgi:hypothetical protein